jgi:hypothetical protein
MTGQQAEGMYLFSDAISADQRPLIARLAINTRLPSSFPERSYADAAGLMSYGHDFNVSMQRRGLC